MNFCWKKTNFRPKKKILITLFSNILAKNDYYTVLLPLNTIGLEYNYSSEYIQHYILQTQYAVHTYIHIKEERKKKRISMMNCKNWEFFIILKKKNSSKNPLPILQQKKTWYTWSPLYTFIHTYDDVIAYNNVEKNCSFFEKNKKPLRILANKEKKNWSTQKCVVVFISGLSF